MYSFVKVVYLVNDSFYHLLARLRSRNIFTNFIFNFTLGSIASCGHFFFLMADKIKENRS